MTETTVVLSRPLVAGHKRDGRRCYDPEAKRELVEACLRPGISVARVALEHGINANLLRKWMDGSGGKAASARAASPVSWPAFVPVMTVPAPEPSGMSLSVALPNGVELELRGVEPGDLASLLSHLASLPCSASNRG
jgi:transposase